MVWAPQDGRRPNFRFSFETRVEAPEFLRDVGLDEAPSTSRQLGMGQGACLDLTGQAMSEPIPGRGRSRRIWQRRKKNEFFVSLVAGRAPSNWNLDGLTVDG